MIALKNWIFTNNNKKYKKQQLLKALTLSYKNRKKKKTSIYSFLFFIKNRIKKVNYNIGICPIIYNNINFNWLLN